MKTRVKICGITNQTDALFAAQVGADALGFVFYTPSPRAVSAASVASIVSHLPAFVTTTGLFVNATAAEVSEVLAVAELDLLQFHGDETPEFCESFGRPYIKALRMRPELDIAAEAARYQAARGILLDAYVPGVPGGTGKVFDWESIPSDLAKPLILAGGLGVDNVRMAIEQVRPWAVDVSGGVEAAHGIKDHDKVAAFMQQVGCASAD